MSPTDQLARLTVRTLLRRIETGSLTVVEPGRRWTVGTAPPAAVLQVHDPRAWRALLKGSRGLAEAFAAGWLDSPDLVALIRLAARNGRSIDGPRQRLALVRGPLQALGALLRPATRRRSRADIAAHYDLGNALFSRMLDPTMSYSCAVFERPEMTLEEAQEAKLELVCRKLDLRPTDHLLEIGTGWGGLALYAARTRGCRVTTTTISAEQHAHARAQVRQAGLEHRVTVLCQDYRDLRGSYDKLVSIEMIEAVGWRNRDRFLAKCSSLLHPHGTMLLQAITIDDRAYEVEKSSRSFIRTYIFPGGSLPSVATIAAGLARRTDMQMVELEDITPHYVETLRRWRERFLAHADELDGLGYDKRFRRIWTLYLAYCEGGFAERRICDVQMLLAKPAYRTGIAGPHESSERMIRFAPSTAADRDRRLNHTSGRGR
jgi:cyclopropane-fatty-acyl-phospholipid synthase